MDRHLSITKQAQIHPAVRPARTVDLPTSDNTINRLILPSDKIIPTRPDGQRGLVLHTVSNSSLARHRRRVPINPDVRNAPATSTTRLPQYFFTDDIIRR